MVDTKNMVQVGPWGGSGGGPWEFILPSDSIITGIDIHSGDVVDSICFYFKDQQGNTSQSSTFGGKGGDLNEIRFGDEETITKISGRFGLYANDHLTVVTSLTIVTNQYTYPSHGTFGGTDFSLPVTEGKITGFHGKFGSFLDSIGVVLSA